MTFKVGDRVEVDVSRIINDLVLQGDIVRYGDDMSGVWLTNLDVLSGIWSQTSMRISKTSNVDMKLAHNYVTNIRVLRSALK